MGKDCVLEHVGSYHPYPKTEHPLDPQSECRGHRGPVPEPGCYRHDGVVTRDVDPFTDQEDLYVLTT